MKTIINKLSEISNHFDCHLQKLYSVLFFCFALVTCYYYAVGSLLAAESWDGYLIGDWLINFSGGFVRRGLSGEIFLFLSQLTDISPNYLVAYTHIFFFSIFSILLFNRLKSKNITFFYFYLVTCPAAYFFFLLNPDSSGRKEVILFIIFILWTLTLEKNQHRKSINIYIFSLLMSLATLLHEVFFLFSLYFVFSAYLKEKDLVSSIRTSWPIVFSSVTTGVLIFLLGGSIKSPEICQRLMEFGSTPEICKGVMNFPPNNFSESILFVYGIMDATSIVNLIIFILFFIAINTVFLRQRLKGQPYRIASILLALSWAPSLLLFVGATDWGRWIHIHFFLTVISYFLLLKSKEDQPLHLPKFQKLTITRRNVKLFLMALALLFTSLTWKPHLCCVDSFKFGGFLKEFPTIINRLNL